MMKKVLSLLMLISSFLLTSCVTDAQVMYEYGYYDYMNPSTTIIYRGSIPYYYIWDRSSNRWIYSLVPRERIPYIRYGHRPIQRHEIRPPMRPYNRPNIIHREIPRNDNHRGNTQHGNYRPNIRR